MLGKDCRHLFKHIATCFIYTRNLKRGLVFMMETISKPSMLKTDQQTESQSTWTCHQNTAAKRLSNVSFCKYSCFSWEERTKGRNQWCHLETPRFTELNYSTALTLIQALFSKPTWLSRHPSNHTSLRWLFFVQSGRTIGFKIQPKHQLCECILIKGDSGFKRHYQPPWG